jgi:hypothetical protein
MTGGASIKPNAGGGGRIGCFLQPLALALLIAASILLVSLNAASAQGFDSAGERQFDIPSQPLAAALRAYGEVTGLEFFYDGSLSIGRQSTAVKGTFTPMAGLKVLLRGTGYIARATDIANAVTIVSAPSLAPVHATFDRYQPYFAALQARLSEALCNNDKVVFGGEEVTFRFWIDSSGVISYAEFLGSSASDGWRREIAARVHGLHIGKAPPAGLPEPLTMVIYPAAADEATGCSSNGSRHARN